MYKFTDTNNTATVMDLPVEALSIDGAFIENEIPGYRTLGVGGREILSQENITSELTRRNGTLYRGSNYPERELTIEYQLLSKTPGEFRDKFNKLNSILGGGQKKLIFNDEPDKYFIGSLDSVDEVEKGLNNVKSSFTFKCADPFKYSIHEKEVSTDELDFFNIDYKGTAPAFPVITTEFYKSDASNDSNGDCGYVAFVKDDKVLQFGDLSQIDTKTLSFTELAYSETFNTSMPSHSGIEYGNDAVVGGVTNHTGKTSAHTFYTREGGLAVKRLSTSGTWGSIRLPVAQLVGSEADNFYLKGSFSYTQKLTKKSRIYDIGGVAVSLVSSRTGMTVGGFCISAGNKQASSLLIRGLCRKTEPAISQEIKKDIPTKTSSSPFMISKFGETITVQVGDINQSFSIPTEYLDSAKADTIIVSLTNDGNLSKTDRAEVWYLDLFASRSKVVDAPNTFTTNDYLVCDCNTGDVKHNDLYSPGLGYPLNNWESFALTPGLNTIGTQYSNWVSDEHKPTFKLRYREVFV